MSEPPPGWSRYPAEHLRLAEGPEPAVHVLRLWLRAEAAVLAGCEALLDAAETERVRRFRVSGKRREFTLTRAALRTVLAGVAGVRPQALRFEVQAHGKPALAFPPDLDLTFNVSHSHGLAVIALSRRVALGIDVEKMRDRVSYLSIATRFFSPAEQRALARLPPAGQRRAFFRCWSRKEAVIKGNGRGIGLGLDRFDVSLGPQEAPALLATRWDPDEAARWQLAELDVGPEFAGALAVRAPAFRLRLWDLDARELAGSAGGA